MVGTYKFVSLNTNIMLLELKSLLSILWLINDISSDLLKLLKYLNRTKFVKFFRILLFPSVSMSPNNLALALYLKVLKIVLFSTSTVKFIASTSE